MLKPCAEKSTKMKNMKIDSIYLPNVHYSFIILKSICIFLHLIKDSDLQEADIRFLVARGYFYEKPLSSAG